jgi:hypothetical protein
MVYEIFKAYINQELEKIKNNSKMLSSKIFYFLINLIGLLKLNYY